MKVFWISTELSGAYSVTENVILQGDYKLNYLNKTEKSKLDIFASKSELETVNLKDAVRFADIEFNLHLLITVSFLQIIEQIIAYKIIAYNVTTPFNSYHFLVIFESNLSLKSESDNIKTLLQHTNLFNSDHFLVIIESILSWISESDNMITLRKFRLFSRSKFNRDLLLAKWWIMHQCENSNHMFDSFIDIFEKIVEKHALIQTVKKWGERFKNFKPGLTQELKQLITQKHFLLYKWEKNLTVTRTKILSS